MKNYLPSILLSFFGTLALLPAQEAWLLEMPNKYSDYLVKKSIAGDHDTVAGIIEKLPNLIAAKQVREVELIKWEAEGGKVNKKEKVTQGTRTINAGARYYSARGKSLESRKFSVTPASETDRAIKIDLQGVIPRTWIPTFVHRGEKLTLILLERHAESETATVSLGNSRQLEFDAGAAKALVAWYSSDPLDTKKLSYQSLATLLANPSIKFGTKIFTSVSKDGPTLLRIEAHSQDPAGQEKIFLQHNEAKFEGHAQTTGPLKFETIKVADKSFTAGENKGAWTLTLTGE